MCRGRDTGVCSTKEQAEVRGRWQHVCCGEIKLESPIGPIRFRGEDGDGRSGLGMVVFRAGDGGKADGVVVCVGLESDSSRGGEAGEVDRVDG